MQSNHRACSCRVLCNNPSSLTGQLPRLRVSNVVANILLLGYRGLVFVSFGDRLRLNGRMLRKA
jgi:hypothetical protein